jgi:hypothetical protein
MGMTLAGSHAWSAVEGLQPTGGVGNYLVVVSGLILRPGFVSASDFKSSGPDTKQCSVTQPSQSVTAP